MAIRSRLALLVTGTALMSACGAGGVATAPAETDVVPMDAVAACEDWLQADRNRVQLVEYLVREFGGDPTNPNSEPNEGSWVVRLAGSPFYESYYTQLASLTTNGSRGDVTAYATAYTEGPAIMSEANVDELVVEAIGATYRSSQGRPQFEAGADEGSLVGLRMGNGSNRFAARFAGLPGDIEETVDEAVSDARERCRS